VLPLAFSEDGCWLASGHTNGTIRVWEVASGREFATIEEHHEVVRALDFGPDGRLASASDEGTLRLWLVRPADVTAEACARLTRNLTQQEWLRYLGDEPYRRTSPELPGPG
jgi:WD40 repeat protein